MLVQNLEEVLGEFPSPVLADSNPSIPDLLSHSCGENELRLALHIGPEMDCFSGHFPGNPVLPGIVQLQWAVELARIAFGIAPLPRHILRLKFKSIIVPPSRVELSLAQRAPCDVNFSYSGDGKSYSQGVLRFDEGS